MEELFHKVCLEKLYISCLICVISLSLNLLLAIAKRETQVHQFSSVQLPSRVQLFETPWTAAYQASLSLTIS